MVSFQTLFPNLPSPLHHPTTITQLGNIPSKKRKLDTDLQEPCYQLDSDSKLSLWMNTRRFNPQKSSAMDEISSAPSPNTQAEYLYSTGTHKRSSERSTRETTPHPATLGLDLELNLTCGDHQHAAKLNRRKSISGSASNNRLIPSTLSLLSPSPAAADEQEMVAAACKRCHLLVMLCKSYPACPNCKFMHHHNPPNLIAQPKAPSLMLASQ